MAQNTIKANTIFISMDGEITTTCFIFLGFSFIEFIQITSHKTKTQQMSQCFYQFHQSPFSLFHNDLLFIFIFITIERRWTHHSSNGSYKRISYAD